MTGLDIEAYFRRIGYDGPRAPTAAVLRALHELHPRAIPFENLDVLLRRRIHLDGPALERKLVAGARGGYCYEQNLLLAAVLRALGFAVRGLAAKVVWGYPPEMVRPRTHMLLEVGAEGETFIADVGFGGLTLSAPLRLVTGMEQATPHETFRLAPTGSDYRVEVKIDGEWRGLYRFDRVEQFAPDYEVLNWFASTYPTSPFTTELMAARVLPDRRLALANRQFSTHHRNGPSERRLLATDRELREVLSRDFGIQLADDAETAAMLAAVKHPPVAAVAAAS